MTAIEICNSYQMSILVTATFSFIAGRYCAIGNFFLLVFFPAKEFPFLRVRLKVKGRFLEFKRYQNFANFCLNCRKAHFLQRNK